MLTMLMRQFALARSTRHSAARAVTAACLLAVAQPAQADDRFTKFGDIMQFALPLAAMTCAVRQGRAGETALGYAVQAAAVHGSKAILRDARLNQRPDGSGHGFPSGHSASAMFGAANLAQFCYKDNPAMQFATYSLALAVGLSRIDADRHTPLQVAAGLAVGFFVNGLRVKIRDDFFSISYTWRF